MGTPLTPAKIQAILRDHLHPFDCECHTQSGNSLSVRLYRDVADGEEFTAMGITLEQCRDAARLVRLAQELRIELYATAGSLAVQDVDANTGAESPLPLRPSLQLTCRRQSQS